MLNPFQKNNLKLQKPTQGSTKYDPQDKPKIVETFEAIMGSEYRIKRSGRAMLSLCPFHGENNPSFAMYEDTNSYFCFTCGVAGDSFKFIMEQMNCDFLAAKQYATDNGLFENL